jgi:hypothetical protein
VEVASHCVDCQLCPVPGVTLLLLLHPVCAGGSAVHSDGAVWGQLGSHGAPQGQEAVEGGRNGGATQAGVWATEQRCAGTQKETSQCGNCAGVPYLQHMQQTEVSESAAAAAIGRDHGQSWANSIASSQFACSAGAVGVLSAGVPAVCCCH